MERRWVDLCWAIALSVGATMMIQIADVDLGLLSVPAVFVVCYLGGRRMSSLRPAVIAFGVAGVLSMTIAFLRSGSSPISAWITVIALEFALAVLPWWAGRYRRLRADRVVHEQHIVSTEARLRERARIAQDMHDSLGHDLALIALRTGALELAPGATEEQRKAAADLRVSAVAATDRLREIVGVLREEDQSAPRHPAGESIEEMVTRARKLGIEVTLHSNVQHLDERPRMVVQAAHRVVQEGITNAAKHAPGAPVTVSITDSDDQIVVSVVNGQPANVKREPTQGSGFGLAGLDERVRLLGGSFQAGPRGDGHAVVARIPLRGKVVADRVRHGGATDDDHDRIGSVSIAATVADARRMARRRQLHTAVLPLALAVLLVAVLIALQAATVIMTALSPDRYRQIQIGRTRPEISGLLPSHSVRGVLPVGLSIPPAPPGSSCEFYQARGNVFDVSQDMYRFCFDGSGTLTAKDHLTVQSE
ncbi:two-component sensor histidine kinase [Planotetraspora thailandica]|uniref:histidine kinase n=1 Tax=Planotetraspora thailandica TaxID=487172 RepID=A0A8J3XWD7_9ACTN|nr:histidine kinase [Planotetraspora thailandica]GII57502.1 two-component sensor histidine kinase [Planotetraspora thailandica]